MYLQTTSQKKPTTYHRLVPTVNNMLQHKCVCGKPITANNDCFECNKKQMILRRKAVNINSRPDHAPPIVHEVLRSPGRPLAPATRAFMEPRFGHDFSGVRVYSDGKAAASARAVNALAYTVGSNIAFGSGQYMPGTSKGENLLIHELTHVVQQNSTSQPTNLTSLAVMPAVHPAEREASNTAQQLQAGLSGPEPVNHQTIALQRQAEGESFSDKIARGIEAVTETVAELSEGIMHQIRCSLPATENPLVNPLSDMSTFQSPGGSGWRGAIFGCFRNNCTRQHRGWDIHAPVGTTVKAVVEGTMTRHQNPGGYGDYVTLRSAKNPDRTYRYAHLSQREPAGTYCVGDKLGETGVTGNASANRPHLHFEVRNNNAAQDPVSFLTEPTRVVGQVGNAAIAIDKAIPAPCVPC